MDNKKDTIIALNFDGTCVSDEYPEIGFDIGAIPVLKLLQSKKNFKFILFTLRSGKDLTYALNWFSRNGIVIWSVNENPEQDSSSLKPYADIYIDKSGLGIPLINDGKNLPFVNWYRIVTLLYREGYLSVSEVDYLREQILNIYSKKNINFK